MKQTTLDRLDHVLLALWIGIATGIGYIAAPVLFATLDDRKLAGALAGKMFNLVYWLALVVGLYLLLRVLWQERAAVSRAWRFWLLFMANLPTWIALLYIQPSMQALKAQGIVAGSATAKSFGMLHGVSSILYMVSILAGLVLLFFGLRSANAKPRSAIGQL